MAYNTKIAAILKGYIYRRNNMPNSIRYMQHILLKNTIEINNSSDDGRINSCYDEKTVINILLKDELLKNRIIIPKKRCWYDILVNDYQYGLLPVNIKSTTTLTSDNTGNIAMLVYSLTNIELDLKKQYNNGEMTKLFIQYLKNINDMKNKKLKKDYYFLVVNKNQNCSEIIINSLKGLTELTPNINNLPFQIKWCNNKKFKFQSINTISNKIILSIKKPKPSWKEIFLNEIRNIKITD